MFRAWHPGWVLAALTLGFNLALVTAHLPDTPHPDEPRVVRHALAMATGDLNPHFFVYPTLWIYTVFVAQAITAVGAIAIGAVDGKDALAGLVFTDPSLFFIPARILTALAAAGAVLLAWRIGSRFSSTCAWTTALSLALFSPFVRQSHNATTDVPLTFMILLCLDTTLRNLAARENIDRATTSARWLVWPAITAGLAASIKYNGVLVLGAVITAILVQRFPQSQSQSQSQSLRRPWRTRVLQVLLAVAGAGLAFLLTSPFVLLAFPEFLRDAGEILRGIPIVEGVDPGPFGYLRFAAEHHSVEFVAAGLVGWLLLALQGRREPLSRGRAALVLAAFFVPYLLIIEASSYRTPRTFLPFVPAIGLGVGVTLECFHGWLRARVRSATALSFAIGFVLAILLAPSLLDTIRSEREFAAPLASSLAKRWFLAHGVAGSRVVVDAGSGLELPPDSAAVRSRIDRWSALGSPKALMLANAYTHYLDTDLARQGFQLALPEDIEVNTWSMGRDKERDYQVGKLDGARYVIVTSSTLQDVEPSPRGDFYRVVRDRYRVVHEVVDRRGFAISILERTPSYEGESQP